MENTSSRILVAGLCFLGLFLSGFYLNRHGKPYRVIPFNLHKFIGLGTAIFLGVMIIQKNQQTPLAALEIAAVGVVAVFFVITIVSGGLLNTGTPRQKILLIIHHITPSLTVLSTAITLYLLVFY
jgi:hypothetical protein